MVEINMKYDTALFKTFVKAEITNIAFFCR